MGSFKLTSVDRKVSKAYSHGIETASGGPQFRFVGNDRGKVTEQGHEPRNVQVVMEEGTLQGRITLQDEEGDSVQEQPAEEDSGSSGSSDSSGPGL